MHIPYPNELSTRSIPTLADETWLHIFHTCISTSFTESSISTSLLHLSKTETLPAQTTPFCLSAVCTSWRRICLSSTSLWSTIYLWLRVDADWSRKHKKTRMSAQGDAFELWIERSGPERPLHIALGMDHAHFEFGCSESLRIAEALVEAAGRIAVLDMIMPEWLYQFIEGEDFTRLEVLKLVVPEVLDDLLRDESPQSREPVAAPPLDFSMCKHLGSISITGMFEANAAIVLPESWDTVTDVSATHLVPGDCLKILDSIPNLKRASFELLDHLLDHWWGDEWDFTSPFNERREGPVLDTLEINKASHHVVRSLLNITPLSLKHLKLGVLSSYDTITLCYLAPRYNFVLTTIPAFAESLQSLTLHNTLPHFDPLLSILPQMKALVELEIQNDWDGVSVDPYESRPDALDRSLLGGPDNDWIVSILTTPGVLPRLQRFWCTVLSLGPKEFADEVFLNFLRYRRHYAVPKARADSCSMIQDVKFISVVEQDMEISPWAPMTLVEIRGMIEDGLNIALGQTLVWDEDYGRIANFLQEESLRA
ncbi:hypothetical protein DFP72DRAFT_893509 [Ephemerocybe angulata]|uniref:F-box domain-containing protein n=1 Tax=Ephemerocybe angulata TaxID=980116 RepID=A0A8H6MA57_9AGAR|nr:hypothetical protein DFP72DRAFT_893509 [Tulosesus angulatus]